MNSRNVLAFLVMALNPRRPYDDDYKAFVHLLTQQVTTPQLSAVILREEVERRQQLEGQEALDRERLYKELSESESKFARFATRAPIGLAILKPDGTALSANGKLFLLLSLQQIFRCLDCEQSFCAKETILLLLSTLEGTTVADEPMQNFGET